MTGTLANLLLNALIVVLLIATIFYCRRLNRRIRILQDSKGELALLLKHFDESTQRASESIIALQAASKKIGETIQSRVEKANYLLDDLSFMLEKGNRLASQLEAGFAVNRARSRVIAEEKAPPPEEQAAPEPPPVKPVPVMERTADKPSTQREKTAASLEAVLERVMGRGKPPEQSALRPAERPAAQPLRSKAEQELLNMLKIGIKG